MRIPIREQLGLLVLLTSLVALAVIASATWVTSYDFVVGIRLSNLSLSASLYGQQLLANLVLLESSVQSVATRVLVQASLQRYNNDGNNTAANWVQSSPDIGVALSGAGVSRYLLQARLWPKNGTGAGGPYGLINVTGPLPNEIPLPYTNSDGTPVFLGDDGLGYPPDLYPNLTHVPSGPDLASTSFDGDDLPDNALLFLGPMQINSSFALGSITVPVINNTSSADVLGWLTVVVSCQLIYNVTTSTEALGNTGEILLVGPDNPTNKYYPGIEWNSLPQENQSTIANQNVRFVLPPTVNNSRSTRHASRAFGQTNSPFTLSSYPAVLDAVSVNDSNGLDNAGSILSSTNEEKDHISVGYALPSSRMVNWVVLVEQDYAEVIAPIHHLRNVLIACVFGTTGGLLLLSWPIAHYSVAPIRRLRDATKRTVDPYGHPSDQGSIRTSTSSEAGELSGDEEIHTQIARKEGFVGQLVQWTTGRRRRRAIRKELTERHAFRIPGKVADPKHVIKDELTDLTTTFNEMSEELMMQYERLEQRVKERTEQLELSKKAAEAANESKTLFIANISHELKTPLNGILGMCAVCMQEEDQTKIKRSLGIIYKSGDLLLHLLTDLLTFSRNQIGQQLALEEKEFRLADVRSQILSIFEKQAKEGSIKLRVVFEGPKESLDTASGTPGQAGYGPWGTGRVRDMCVWGDQHRILQVIINLVSNSLKFTPPGGSIDVHIACVGEAEDDKASSMNTSRKNSAHSRQSKQSKQSKGRSSRALRSRDRTASNSDSAATSPKGIDGQKKDYIDTALQINEREPKVLPQLDAHDRSSSPAPINARNLQFEIRVEDTGPGIPESQQRRIFEPFVQGDLGLSKKYGGTGLGLSICSQLAGLMGGKISLNSQEGVGSTFTMGIPLKFLKERADSTTSSNIYSNSRRNSLNLESVKDEPRTPQRTASSSDISLHSNNDGAPGPGTSGLSSISTPAKPRLVGLSQPFFATSSPLESPNAQLEAMERVAAEASRSGDKVRVLVAEDNKVNQEVVLRMLKLEDIYDVTVAKDGQEALEMVKESMQQHRLFNLVFMDIQMPNLDGLQSTRLIREMGFSAPIVALTAFAEESNVKECMDSGMDYFLPKPIRRPALKQVLNRYCATIPEAPEESDGSPKEEKQVNGSSNAATPADQSDRPASYASAPTTLKSSAILNSPSVSSSTPFGRPTSSSKNDDAISPMT